MFSMWLSPPRCLTIRTLCHRVLLSNMQKDMAKADKLKSELQRGNCIQCGARVEPGLVICEKCKAQAFRGMARAGIGLAVLVGGIAAASRFF
eukprot:g4255.t1